MTAFMNSKVEKADGISAEIDRQNPQVGQVTVTVDGEWRIYLLDREALQRLHRQLGRALGG